MKITILSFIVLFTMLLNGQSQTDEYVWTGDADGISLYQEANWSMNGTNPAQIDPLTPITFNLRINDGDLGGSGGFSGTLLLGGNTLTITGGLLNGKIDNGAGIGTFESSNGQKSNINISGGKIVCDFLMDININISNSAKVELSNISSPLAGTTISFDVNSSGYIILHNTPIEDVRNSILPNIKVGGSAAVENDNIFLSTLSTGTLIFLENYVNENTSGNKDYSDVVPPNNGPNIIFILMDDMGYGDLGRFWQNQRAQDPKMATPVLDNMASEGCIMTQHYCGAPVCAPSRASLIEGLDQGHSSVRNNQFDKAIKEGLTMPALLQKAGYRTMHIGKNGLAGERGTDLPSHPLKIGFDQFYGYLYHNQGHIHYPLNGTTGKNSFFTDGYKEILVGTDLTYTTDVFTAKAKQWITTHESARPQQPFFLYLAYDVPHSALEVPTQAYPSGKGLNGGVQWTGYNSSTPWVNTASGTRDSYIHPDYASKNWPTAEKKFATMIRRVDNAVDDLIQLLKDLNIDDNTIIVFSSDNGPHNINHSPQYFQSYAFMDGIKRDMWEGGLRMPVICRYPGVIPPNSEVDFPSGHWDWLATFADLASVPIPAYTDGVSLLPSLKQEEGQITKGYLYHEYYVNSKTPSYADFELNKQGRRRYQMQVIRMGDYKGIRYDISSSSDNFEIYNVVTDPKETTNLASSMPALQSQMKEKVLQVRRVDSSAPRPYDNDLIPGVEISSPVAGLSKKVYSGKCQWVPNFDYLTPLNSTIKEGLDMSSEGLTSEFGIYFNGYINIPSDGTYTFYLQSAAKCHIMLHDIHLLDNDYTYTGNELSATVNLKAGMHPIRIFYQQNDLVTPNISLQLKGPRISKAEIPNSLYYTEKTKALSTTKVLTDQLVKTYPNPVDNYLYVKGVSNKKSIQIFDMHGKQMSFNYDNEKIDIKHLQKGIYLLKTENDTIKFSKK